MIKPNWNIFKAKFSDNPQYHFEWFCYLLFCNEVNKPHGVFRYKNQSAIETNPVEYKGCQLGFQSKFYDTTLSSNKIELLKMLDKAKRDYPILTKLFLYTNQEWSQAFPNKENPNKQAKEPAAKIEIDEKAKQLGIVLEWRTLSYFESPYVSQNCSDISKYFFVEDHSLYNLIKTQERHTESILKSIKDEIHFSGKRISIDRANVQKTLINSDNQVSIVCGKGGIGKTVEIKKLYQTISNSNPIFAFKATEFELNRLNDLMTHGNTEDFLALFGDTQNKIIVIDSAEKLIDLQNQEPIKEFIEQSIKFGWRIVFTTREHYFDDLNYLCIDVLNVKPSKIYIPALTDKELNALSSEYSFVLPNEQRLQELIKVPFYLNEYLRFYGDTTEQSFDYKSFKEYLWKNKIRKSDLRREQVFSELALQRANKGRFYLSVKDSHLESAGALIKDEILGADGASFFISHDIYEEWALEKHIDIAYKNKSSTKDFFVSIGKSLSIRRCFRHWLSEQLFTNELKTKTFIENAIDDDTIESIWKDELIVAILLSEYSYSFFENFEIELLQEDLKLLKRICFILRIACKEIDDSLFSLLGIKQKNNKLVYSLFFTKPKGAGWSSLIDFIYSHKEKIGQENLKLFIPVFYEWNNSIKQGTTTRKASLLCIEYYKWLESTDHYIRSGKFTDSIINTISYGAFEIQEELSCLIDKMCKKNEDSRTTSFSHLAKLILKDLSGIHIAKHLPEKTLKLAKSLWLKDHKRDQYSSYHREAEHIFGVTDDYDFKYNPDSALQTPIFYLLKFNLKETVDFILSFTNQITLNLVNHYDDEKFQTHDLVVDNKTNKIYLDNQLWGAYRGAGNTPDLVKSILMALEKFFLENAEHFKDNDLEVWLKYILSKTNSSAICGIVSSIVLANKDKLFNVAKILFKVKKFIQFDTERLLFDSHHKRQLEMLGSMFGGMQHGKMYHDERIKSCDAEHRTNSLESLYLYYQLFGLEGVIDESEVQNRQKELWCQLDYYYDELKEVNDTESSKLWRMCLARMDRRKMDISTEVVGDKIAINFNPEIASDLKEMSESNQVKQERDYKYFPLNLWASNKLKQHKDYKKYQQYESAPKQAVADLKELLEKLIDHKNPPTEEFIILNNATHIFASAALIKYHSDNIEEDDLTLCTQLVINHLNNTISKKYQYQIGDGIESCFDIIPDLFRIQPELRPMLKTILLSGLFRMDSIDIMGGQHFYIFAINAVCKLWSDFEKDAESLLIGYLILKPNYLELISRVRQENYKRNEFNLNMDGLWQRFFDENDGILEELYINKIQEQRTVDYLNLDMNTKAVALCLLPYNKRYIEIFIQLVNTTAASILSEDRDRSDDYHSKNEFLKKYAYYLLQSPKEDIPELLKPFLDEFNTSEGASDLLEEIIYAQDHLAAYDNFWQIWKLFKPKVVQLSQAGYLSYRSDKIIRAYLFSVHWKAEAKSWHTLKEGNARFFNEMSEKLSKSPSTLYSLSKLLNNIGSDYLPQGVHWIAAILISNNNLSERDLDDNTISYINTFIRKYLYSERTEVRKSPELMSKVIVILDFLIEQGEVSGYLMKESVV